MTTSSNPPVIVLVTVNEYETHAVLDAFLGAGEAPNPLTRGGVTYLDLGLHGGNRIIHTHSEMGAGGAGAAQQRTRDAIDHWQPKAIIAVGIGFGVDEKQQSIGDVLVSTQIQDYELGRLNHTGLLTPRGAKPDSADTLRNRLRQIDIIEKRRNKDAWPKLRFGLILCGQKLVDNLDYRESLKALFTEAIGGEMEGSGVYGAVSAKSVDWIVIKAICDWGHDKNHPEKNAWQKLAANNAALVLKTALCQDGLYAQAHEQVAAAQPAKPEPAQTPVIMPKVDIPAPVQSPTPVQVRPQPAAASGIGSHTLPPAHRAQAGNLPAPPAWALASGQDAASGYVLAPNPWGDPVRVAWPLQVGAQMLWQRQYEKGGGLHPAKLVLMLDQIGLFATMQLQNKAGSQFTQVLRYISPGQFMMGSPEAEINRTLANGWFKNELPQHTVVIGAGLWLADTACTQQAWHTVMGNNPSQFQGENGGGPHHPVEQLSWHDVQGFLQQLDRCLPACRASLPTEAEWEYACRAGTNTPFWFGAGISSAQVNYNGTMPFGTDEKGEYRRHTVAVKDLPANGWGLYQMHGNVWEWCADPLRDYTARAELDPGLVHVLDPGLGGEAARVLRGGGWLDLARLARSAFRLHNQPDGLDFSTGFRFALRSSTQGQQGG